MLASEIDSCAKIIWDYHQLKHELRQADCILVLGSSDTRVAKYAAELFLKNYAPLIIFSGGFGRSTRKTFEKSEAKVFADIAIGLGVPPENILLETESTNTGENIHFSRKLLLNRGLDVNSFILVQKPYMERRSYATFKKIWPEKEVIVTSPKILFENYPDKELLINKIVSDLQRIIIYPQRGFQIKQAVPKVVLAAYEKLVKAGYNKQLVKDIDATILTK